MFTGFGSVNFPIETRARRPPAVLPLKCAMCLNSFSPWRVGGGGDGGGGGRSGGGGGGGGGGLFKG